MTNNIVGFGFNFGFANDYNAAPPPPSPPPGPPAPPGPPPSAPAPETPVDRITVTGVRLPPGGYGFTPFRIGGGAPKLTTPPPPVPPPPEDVEVVVVTAPRTPRFASKEDAISAAVSEMSAHPNRSNRELGFFVLQVGTGYDLSEIIVGPDSESLGTFSSNAKPGEIQIPANAVGLIHSHPPANFSGLGFDRNLYPSRNDMNAWGAFERFTGKSDFIMWIVGPDGSVREFGQETDVPPRLPDEPRPPSPDKVPVLPYNVDFFAQIAQQNPTAMNRRSTFGLNSVLILALLSMSLSGCSILDKAQILSPATETPISAIVSPTLFYEPALVSYEYKAKYFPQKLVLRFDQAESGRAAGKLVSVSAVGCTGPAIEVPQQSYQQMQGRFYLATVVTDVTRSGKCDTRSLSINLKQILRRENGENVILQYVLSYENGAFSLSLDESQNMTLSFEAQD